MENDMGETTTERMTVVEELCTFSADMSSGKIVIQSTEDENFAQAIEELGSVEARNMALGHAARQGVATPGINGNLDGPYAVNEDGQSLDEVKDEEGNALPPGHPKMQPAAYRVAVPVCRKMV
jgi:hypothetical protein